MNRPQMEIDELAVDGADGTQAHRKAQKPEAQKCGVDPRMESKEVRNDKRYDFGFRGTTE
jgi:hypothetical protein